MAAARLSPPVYMINCDVLVGKGEDHAGKGGEGWAEPTLTVDNGNLTGKPGEGWTEIEIARREAYGCGDSMRQALDGLSLCVRLGGAPLVTSTLGLRISRDARDRFNSELGLDASNEREMPAVARIMMQDQGLLIMVLLFEHHYRDDLAFYLVYDRTDASLSMISWLPDGIEVIGMFRSVPYRTLDGAYEMFVLARKCDDDQLPLSSEKILCEFSPLTGTSRTSAWEMRRTLRWNVPDSLSNRFRADMTFSFQGKGFWADLSQALVCCDLHNTTSDDDDSALDFGYIDLPKECQLELEEMLDCKLPMEVTRTIACVRDSIWFVCIRRSEKHADGSEKPADDLVTMWTLEMPHGMWQKKESFTVRKLWGFDGFEEARLPEARVGYPVLMADGSLCLLVQGKVLKSPNSDVSSLDHICIFDVCNKRLLWHGSVRDHIFNETVALPPDFFPMKHGSHKRKFDKLHPAAGSGFGVSSGPIKGQGA